jgi:phosphate transport system substrate-binding protein
VIKLFHTAVLVLAVATLASAQNLEKPAPKPNPPLPYDLTVDPAIPAYKPLKGGLYGTLKGVESNTVNDIMDAWIAGFTRIYPNVHITCDIGGSGQGGPRLTSGAADFAYLGREMMGREELPFVEKFGYKPLDIDVSGGSLNAKAFTDSIVFIVNKDNPLNELTFQQLDAIYSFTHNRGLRTPITTWGQLGLTGEWKDAPIHLWGVEIPNGYDNFVNMKVLAYGQWRDGIKTNRVVIPLSDEVAKDKFALSYTGYAWVTNPDTKVLKLAVHPGDPYIMPTLHTVADQTYPLSRVILFYINRPPGKPINPVLREFIRYILSQQGQQAVVNDAIFTPLPAALDAKEAAKLQ